MIKITETIRVDVDSEINSKKFKPKKQTKRPSAIFDFAESHFFSTSRLLLKYFVL